MIETRIIPITTKALCHVTYYVLATPCVDPHFKPEPSYIVDNRFFETKEEAEAFKEKLDLTTLWTMYKVCERVERL